jgi:hypothetical protein
MSDTAALAIPDDTKPCKVCGEPIKKVARVCIHCNNYQNWRAELNISGTVLALLVALTSVIGVTAPIIKKTLTPDNSHVIYRFAGIRNDLISVLATNDGIRPAAILLPIEIAIYDESGEFYLDFSPKGKKGSALIIENGKNILLELEPDILTNNAVDRLDRFVHGILFDAKNTHFMTLHFPTLDFNGGLSGGSVTLSRPMVGDLFFHLIQKSKTSLSPAPSPQ